MIKTTNCKDDFVKSNLALIEKLNKQIVMISEWNHKRIRQNIEKTYKIDGILVYVYEYDNNITSYSDGKSEEELLYPINTQMFLRDPRQYIDTKVHTPKKIQIWDNVNVLVLECTAKKQMFPNYYYVYTKENDLLVLQEIISV